MVPCFQRRSAKGRIAPMNRATLWRWYLDEVFVKINGVQRYLWRAVDHEGEVLEAYATKTRDKKSAMQFLKKAKRRHKKPQVVVTDKLTSHGAELREIAGAPRHETDHRLNNRAENSYLSFRRRAYRRRERAMLKFRRLETLGKFTSVHAQIYNHFNLERRPLSRKNYKLRRLASMITWQELAA